MSLYKEKLKKDPKIRPYLAYEVFIPKKSSNIALGLVWSVMSQQLSIKVAKILFKRFLDLFETEPTAVDIKKMPLEKIKAIGISLQKANYIHNIATFIDERKITSQKLSKLTDNEIIDLLTEIKGIGRWSVEMLLIFTLAREDVFALDDLGIQKTMIEMFKLHELDKKELKIRMLKLSERWKPYRSFVCLHMWNFQGF